MTILKLTWLILCATLILPLRPALAQNASPIRIEPAQPFYLLDGPITVCLVMRNISKRDGFLGMNFLGLPGDVRSILVTPDGTPLEGQAVSQSYNPITPGNPGPPGPPTTTGLYPLKSGEEVRMCYDLQQMFTIRKQGKYKLRFTWGPDVLSETQVNILDVIRADEKSFSGSSNALVGISIAPMGAVRVGGNVVISKAVYNGKSLWFANVEGAKTEQHKPSTLFTPLSVPLDTKIETAVVDFKARLWVLFEARGKRSLIAWNLVSRAVETLVPWGTEKIEMGTTPVTSLDTDLKVVIAGIPGKVKISSLSLENK